MNVHDSARMVALMRSRGWEETADPAEADLIAARVQGLLDAIEGLAPDTPLDRLPLLPETERKLALLAEQG